MKYRTRDLNKIIHDTLANAFVALDHLGRQLKAMEIKEEELKGEEETERTRQFKILLSSMALINDIIHPAHKIATALFPESAHPFIAQCIKQRETALASKLINKCACCEVKG